MGPKPAVVCRWNGDEGVVKILGREGINPDRPDNNGLTPLLFAQRGREGV